MALVTRQLLHAFVTESNAIEGIRRTPTDDELDVSRNFIELPQINAIDLQNFVRVCAGPKALLREKPGMDVMVGPHRPPPGGLSVRAQLSQIVNDVNNTQTDARHRHPYAVHHRYETLHPFMDGNGRSGRILWAWQMLHEEIQPGLRLGFLHAWYYQSLQAGRKS